MPLPISPGAAGKNRLKCGDPVGKSIVSLKSDSRTNVDRKETNMQKKQKSPDNKNAKMNARRIVALVGVILLAALYLITLVVAIVDKNSSGTWFMLCLIGTVTIPILIWVYTWMYGVLAQKHTIASFDLGKQESGEENKDQ